MCDLCSCDKIVEGVLGVLSSNRFRRSGTRLAREAALNVEAIVRNGAVSGERLGFALFWGCGVEGEVGDAERESILFFEDLKRRIDGVYGNGTAFVLLLSDTHATVNGVPDATQHTYFHGIEELARGTFDFLYLSSLNTVPVQESNLGAKWEEMSPHLIRSARETYSHRQFDKKAREYFRVRMSEKRLLEERFGGFIFIHFGRDELIGLSPEPAVSLRINRSGSHPPWIPKGNEE